MQCVLLGLVSSPVIISLTDLFSSCLIWIKSLCVKPFKQPKYTALSPSTKDFRQTEQWLIGCIFPVSVKEQYEVKSGAGIWTSHFILLLIVCYCYCYQSVPFLSWQLSHSLCMLNLIHCNDKVTISSELFHLSLALLFPFVKWLPLYFGSLFILTRKKKKEKKESCINVSVC